MIFSHENKKNIQMKGQKGMQENNDEAVKTIVFDLSKQNV